MKIINCSIGDPEYIAMLEGALTVARSNRKRAEIRRHLEFCYQCRQRNEEADRIRLAALGVRWE